MVLPILTLIYDRKGHATAKKPSVVELRISAGKVRKYISTGVKVYPKEWKEGSVIGRKDWKELNDQLQLVKRKCSEIVTRMMEDGSLDLNAVPNILKDELYQSDTFIAYAQELAERKYRTISSGTRRQYELLFKFLDQWRGLRYFSDITERTILKMDDELSKKGLKDCTKWNYHKLVKSFIEQAVGDGIVKRNPYSRLDIRRGRENGLTRYLTPDEFHRFETCVIPTESLRRVRDLFVFQAYTAMGYSDLADFDYSKCTEVDGMKVYTANRVKTDKPFMFVILKPALAILQRYGYQLPIISNVKYNLYLKAAVEYAKIDKPVSSHWARHTGATLLINEGKLPMHIVQHILGHATIKETERTYAKVMDETIIEAMKGYDERNVLTKKRRKMSKAG